MSINLLQSYAQKAGASILKNGAGRIQFAVVAPAGSNTYTELYRTFPEHVFTNIIDADNAFPVATAAQPINSVIYIAAGTYTSSVKQVIAVGQSGLTIYAEPGAELTTAIALAAGDALLEIEAERVSIKGQLTISNTNATQTGSALAIGGTAAGEGTGAFFYGENIIVNGLSAATDWAKPVLVRGADNATFKNCTFYGSTGTTRIVEIAVANARNNDNVLFENCLVQGYVDTGNTCVPISGGTNQVKTRIIGGFFGTDGTGVVADINGADWTLTGGVVFANATAIANKAQVRLTTATTIRIGQVYVKNIAGTTPATLLDQTNI